jgi:hypothetical protein
MTATSRKPLIFRESGFWKVYAGTYHHSGKHYRPVNPTQLSAARSFVKTRNALIAKEPK